MNDVVSFKGIAPYLKDPLVLIGFFLLLAFSFSRYIVKQRVIPPLPKTLGYRILRLILLYGFIIGLLLTIFGFALKRQELINQQRTIENIELMLKDALNRVPGLSEEKKTEITQQLIEAYRSGALSKEQVENKVEEIKVSLIQTHNNYPISSRSPNQSNSGNKFEANTSSSPLATQVEEKNSSVEVKRSIGTTTSIKDPFVVIPNGGIYISPTNEVRSAVGPLLSPTTSPPLTSSSEKSQEVRLYGCLVDGRETVNLTDKKIYPNSNSPAFDNVMSNELGLLNRLFEVHVPLYFLYDVSGTAFFTPSKFPNLISADGAAPNSNVTGSVFIDITLLKTVLNSKSRGMLVPGIVGHEFAHAMQYIKRFPYNGKWRELHADYMAGWYAGLSDRFGGQDILQTSSSFYDQDDYEFFNEYHGNSQQRVRAFQQGFLLSWNGRETSGDRAYFSGLTFVRFLGAR